MSPPGIPAAPAVLRARRTLASVSIVSALVVLLAGLVAYRAVRANDAAAGWVAHTHEVIAQIEATLAAATGAEAAQRAYLLTADPRQLAAYREARGRVSAHVDALQRLTADNPVQRARLPQLRQAIAQRMRGLDLGLERHAAGDHDGAREIVARYGFGLMGEVRRQLDVMHEEENRLLEARVAAARRSTQFGAGATAGTGLLALLLLGTLYLLSARHAARLATEQQILRESREQTRQHAEALRAANAQLQAAAS
ncbi:MAG TPA: CHASE3 domain-containing protein, partial [Lysobacter sp.]